jgi:glucosylceramidase
MKTRRESITGIWLALFLAACSSDEGTTNQNTPPTVTGGASGAVGGTPSSNGGSPASPAGGTPGTPNGGSPAAPVAGAGGSGGSTPPAGGGNPGGPTGGMPTSTGGATMGGGGAATTGGTPSAGGVPASGGGGAAPTAGTPPVVSEPKLVTSANGAWWKTDGTVTEVTDGNADITVNDSPKQNWTGFGGTFNEKGWEALMALSEADRAQAIQLLFGVDGANFANGRIPIGASDYASSRYTLNDNAGDTAMEKFSIDRDKMKLIPYIKAAMGVKSNILFWGSPWTPPPWMKDNNAYDRGNMKDDATTLKAFAVYLSKFVEEYGKEGIKIDAIHPQNEPGYVQDYPSCGWTGALFAKFIGTYLGPTFAERNVTARIFVGTMSNSTNDATVLRTTMMDGTAKALVKGYGLQWGMIDVYGNLGLDTGLEIWQTEHKCGNYPWMGGDASRAPNDMAYGVESWGLIRDWIRKGVTSYSAWNMVLDTIGRSLDTVRPWAQNALLAVDVSGKKLVITPTYYVFRHVSQFTDVGAKVLSASGDALAWKNPDGSSVAVIYNGGGAKKMIVSMAGKKLQFDAPGNGWATVNWK